MGAVLVFQAWWVSVGQMLWPFIRCPQIRPFFKHGNHQTAFWSSCPATNGSWPDPVQTCTGCLMLMSPQPKHQVALPPLPQIHHRRLGEWPQCCSCSSLHLKDDIVLTICRILNPKLKSRNCLEIHYELQTMVFWFFIICGQICWMNPRAWDFEPQTIEMNPKPLKCVPTTTCYGILRFKTVALLWRARHSKGISTHIGPQQNHLATGQFPDSRSGCGVHNETAWDPLGQWTPSPEWPQETPGAPASSTRHSRRTWRAEECWGCSLPSAHHRL